jgi:F-type H+-transporting ATPase subunit epsilon
VLRRRDTETPKRRILSRVPFRGAGQDAVIGVSAWCCGVLPFMLHVGVSAFLHSGDSVATLPPATEGSVPMSFTCSIVTPSESIFEGEIVYATFPAWDGQHGAMPGQSPLLTRLGIGSLRLDFPPPDGGSRWYLIDGGFAQVQDNHLTLLTERATPAEKLNEQEALAELAEASARVAEKPEDRARIERDRQRALARVTMARSAASRGI